MYKCIPGQIRSMKCVEIGISRIRVYECTTDYNSCYSLTNDTPAALTALDALAALATLYTEHIWRLLTGNQNTASPGGSSCG
jgi:hypothetical protein